MPAAPTARCPARRWSRYAQRCETGCASATTPCLHAERHRRWGSTHRSLLSPDVLRPCFPLSGRRSSRLTSQHGTKSTHSAPELRCQEGATFDEAYLYHPARPGSRYREADIYYMLVGRESGHFDRPDALARPGLAGAPSRTRARVPDECLHPWLARRDACAERHPRLGEQFSCLHPALVDGSLP